MNCMYSELLCANVEMHGILTHERLTAVAADDLDHVPCLSFPIDTFGRIHLIL